GVDALDLGLLERVLLLLGLANNGLGHRGAPLSRSPGRCRAPGCRGLEGGLVRSPGRTGRGPRVVGGAAREAAAPAREPAAATAAAGEPATTAGALGAGHLRGRVAQRGSDLVDLELDHRALLTLTGLVRALDEPTLDDHTHALGEGLGDVLGSLAPDRAAQEQRLAVLPLVGLAVEGARGRGDGEVRDGSTRGGEAQLRVPGQVPDHGDAGLAGHALPRSSRGSRSVRSGLVSRSRCAGPWCAARPR